MSHSITLYKASQRSLDSDTLRKQLRYALDRAMGSGRGKGWTGKLRHVDTIKEQGETLYKARLVFERTQKGSEDVVERQFSRIKEIVERAVRGKGWSLNGDSPKSQPKTEEAPPANGYATITACIESGVDKQDHFSHLYNLDSQIELVLSAVEEYQRSDFANRFHCVLYGEPACGKTEILRSLTRMLGQDAVMHFDTTSTTSAGAKQLLTEAATIPPVLCIEEIEKADETSLRWLLGVLDYRAEVRALKFRSGLVSREVKLLCLATVNDFRLFNSMMDGALASRFSHKIYCPRPGREVLQRILEREVTKSGGKAAWIAPALDYCLNYEQTNDPRRIITVCLCGRDKLLDGSYQRTLTATAAPK